MALKSKFERIDQSKLKQGARDVLAKMKEKSENFTNAEVNKKIEPAIDKLIERLKKENPDALKKAKATRTQKPKKTAKKKSTKKAPAKKGGAKRETVMTVAKRIRKDGEKWQDALKRAKSEMGKDTKKKVSAVKTEIDKLQKLIKEDAVLKGFANSELQRDAVRKAKPRGKRKTTTKGETTNQYGTFKNKVGRTYWESRENRSDRYAPKYPKNKPFLEMGGDVTDAQDLSVANADFLVMAEGGEIDAFTMSMVKGVDDGISEVETKDLKARMEKGGALESKFDGYETMYKYALANNFTPRQLAEELRFMTNLQNKGDKELYDFLNNLSNMFPDTPISEFQKGGEVYPEVHPRKQRIIDEIKQLEAEILFISKNPKGEEEYFKQLNVALEDAKKRLGNFYNAPKNVMAKGGLTKTQENQNLKAEKIRKKISLQAQKKYGLSNSEREAYESVLFWAYDKQSYLKEVTNINIYDKDYFDYKKLQDKGLIVIGDDVTDDLVKVGLPSDFNKKLFAKGGELQTLSELDPDGNTVVLYDQDSKEYYWEDFKNDVYRDGFENKKDAYNSLFEYLKTYAKGGMVSSESIEAMVMNLPPNEYENFAIRFNIDPDDANEMSSFIYGLDESQRDFVHNTLKTKNFAKGGMMENNTFANVLKDNGFIEKRSVMGVRIFYNPKKDIYASIDDKNRLVEVFADNDIVGDGMIEYSGYSVTKLIDYLKANKFAKGGRLKSALMRDRKYYNKNESWERAYSKGKNRRGYKENGGTIENSIQSYQNHYKGFPSYEDGGTIADSTQHFRIMETDTPIYKEGGQIDMDL